ncbi:MAG: yijE [Candidatus Eremiobacteraeota bacterium]|nr:yijE [Candidatus Eremiobacteraeota bacterium]
MPQARHLVLLLLTVLVWGYNWVPLKIGATAIDPWWFGAWRVGGGALALFVILAVARKNMAPPPGRAYIWIGIAQVAGLVMFTTLALHFGGIANVTSLVFTMPVFTAIFAYLLLAERLSPARVAWLLVAAAGIAVVASGIRGGNEIVAAVLAACGGASWALGNVLQRRAAYQIDLLRLIAWQQLVATIPLLILAVALGHPVAHLDAGVVAAALFAAVVGSGIAWLWWGNALAALPANTVALASFAIPVIAALSAWAQLGAAPPPMTAIGLAIVVAGLTGSVTVRPRAAAPTLATPLAECARTA